MRKTLMALTAVTALTAMAPATAQDHWGDQRWDDRREAREQYREDRRAAREEYRDARRDWREYRRYDYNRLPPGTRGYYADQYYRDGRYYQPRRLSRNDRLYRGNDGRYYCRRSDGTTGLIVGGAAGGVLGHVIAPGGSKTLGTVLGALGGGLIGNSVDRNNITCR